MTLSCTPSRRNEISSPVSAISSAPAPGETFDQHQRAIAAVNFARGGGFLPDSGARSRCAIGLTSRTASRNSSLSGSMRLPLKLPPR
jgi:hypothetical protein